MAEADPTAPVGHARLAPALVRGLPTVTAAAPKPSVPTTTREFFAVRAYSTQATLVLPMLSASAAIGRCKIHS